MNSQFTSLDNNVAAGVPQTVPNVIYSYYHESLEWSDNIWPISVVGLIVKDSISAYEPSEL